MKKTGIGAVLLFSILTLSACAWQQGPEQDGQKTLTILTHDSYDVDKELISRFEQDNNVTLEFITGGDAGRVVNTAVLQKDQPVADVLYGVDSTFLGRALSEGLFTPYHSAQMSEVDPTIAGYYPGDDVTPIDYGDVCVNYDKAWFASHEVPVPQSITDLVADDYVGLFVAENPATSSPGLAFLLLTIGTMGQSGAMDYWSALRAQEVRIADGWDQAYWGDFSGGGSGDRPLVVSYATSPAAAVYFSEEPLNTAPTGVIATAGSCYRQIEYVGILKGTANEELSRKFIDFMLSREYQEDIPLKMWVYPVRTDAVLPAVFSYAPEVISPMMIRYDEANAKRDEWIDLWTQTVQR